MVSQPMWLPVYWFPFWCTSCNSQSAAWNCCSIRESRAIASASAPNSALIDLTDVRMQIRNFLQPSKSSYIGTAMHPTSLLTATRLLNYKQPPKAYLKRSKNKTTGPHLHEPRLMRIDTLFLSNRAPNDLAHLPDDDPQRQVWMEQVSNNIGLPKIFREAHSIRVHRPRLFRRFPLKRSPGGLTTTAAASSTTDNK